jgi:prophage antirepressor-like protein
MQFNKLVENLKNNPPNYANPTSVKDWFLSNKIRVHPDGPTSLLFCLADVAKVIEDQHYRDFTSNHIKKIQIMDADKRPRSFNMLTEIGLYQYLLKSNRPYAEPFQEWVYSVLVTIRSECVSKSERALVVAKQCITDLTKELDEKKSEIETRDANIDILTNNQLRYLRGFTNPQDSRIIHRCYANNINFESLTEDQLEELRAELRWNEDDMADKLFLAWGLIEKLH